MGDLELSIPNLTVRVAYVAQGRQVASSLDAMPVTLDRVTLGPYPTLGIDERVCFPRISHLGGGGDRSMLLLFLTHHPVFSSSRLSLVAK